MRTTTWMHLTNAMLKEKKKTRDNVPHYSKNLAKFIDLWKARTLSTLGEDDRVFSHLMKLSPVGGDSLVRNAESPRGLQGCAILGWMPGVVKTESARTRFFVWVCIMCGIKTHSWWSCAFCPYLILVPGSLRFIFFKILLSIRGKWKGCRLSPWAS